MTDQQIIMHYLKEVRDYGENDGWVVAGTIRSKQTNYGFIGFRGDRNVRELVSKGRLERRKNGKYAEVRYTPFKEKELSSEELLKLAI